MPHWRAFTLVEIVLAVFILMLLLLLAVPSLNGVLADRRLRHSLDSFNNLVRQAQERSVAERRPYLIAGLRIMFFCARKHLQKAKRSNRSRNFTWIAEMP